MSSGAGRVQPSIKIKNFYVCLICIVSAFDVKLSGSRNHFFKQKVLQQQVSLLSSIHASYFTSEMSLFISQVVRGLQA